MRIKKVKTKGFTMIEVLMASIVTITVMSGASAALIASMKVDNEMRMSTLSQDILKKIINDQVRNKTFMGTANSLCGELSTSTSIASQLINGTVNTSELETSSIWNKPVSIPELSQLPDAIAVLKLRPINVASPGSSNPYYSNSQIKITAIIKWKSKIGASSFHQSQITTTATNGGLFDKTPLM